MRARSSLSLAAFALALAACSSSPSTGGSALGTGSDAGSGGSESTSGEGTSGTATSSGEGNTSGSTGGSASAGGSASGGSASAGTSSSAGSSGAASSSGTASSGAGSSSGSTGAATSSGTASSSGSSSGGSTGSSSGTNACSGGGATQTGGTQYCSANNDKQGSVGTTGYSYEVWTNSQASGCATVFGVDATFSANWTGTGQSDFLARVGLDWGQNSGKTYTQLGTIGADFAETKTSASASYSFIGIYGWSTNPLHEYYIVEDWLGSAPTAGSLGGATKVTTISVDGGMYDVYTHTQNNQPAITGGNATFVQFFSIRQTARTCGHISISDHFDEWAKNNMTLGDMYEAKILVEAGGTTSGTVDFTTATVTVSN